MADQLDHFQMSLFRASLATECSFCLLLALGPNHMSTCLVTQPGNQFLTVKSCTTVW